MNKGKSVEIAYRQTSVQTSMTNVLLSCMIKIPNRQFCCPECCAQAGIDIVKSDLTTDKVDSALPAIGWRMQKGRFLQPDWESILVSPEHKEMARRALAIGK